MENTVIDQLVEVVNEGDSDKASAHILATSLISQLKALNRASTKATRLTKDATTASRQEMDQSHLRLQNLLYEKRHLEREIEKCRQFASIYQDIPLYGLEQFNALAPEQARTPSALADEHQLMLNRLSFELAERQRLDLKKKQVLQVKEDLLKESKTKQGVMDSVKTQIDKLLQTALETQRRVDEIVAPAPSVTSSSPPHNPSVQ